jgi:hypothetical protein
MKNTSLLKVIFLVVLCLVSGGIIQGKNVYLSATGKDTNTGLEEGSPVATVTKAFSLCSDQDVVVINGTIDLSKELSGSNGFVFPDIQLTLDGKNKSTSGFSGNGKMRIFTIHSNTKQVLIKNLAFSAGNPSVAEGALFSVKNSDVRFENCDFNNTESKRSSSNGTVFLNNATNASFTSCVFSNNNVKQGGGLYILNCPNVLLKNSIINDCTTDSEGGAIFIEENDEVANLSSIIRIESCLIANNTSTSGEGAGLYFDNPTEGNKINLSIINTTFYNNIASAGTRGGGLLFVSAYPGSSVDLVNCTIIGNKAKGSSNDGAGLCFMANSKNLKKSIYNCIIESNIAGMDTKKSSDISFKHLVENGKDFFLYHSYVGGITNNNGRYEPIEANNNRVDYQLNEQAELATPYADYIASQNSIPLEYNSSALYMGNAKYLKDLNISTDQNGNDRLFANNKCAVGAVEKAALPPTGGDSHTYQHFIMYGQSLSTGSESYPVSTENIEGNYMIGDQIWINYGNRNFDQVNPLRATISFGLSDISETPLHGAVNHIRLKQQEESPEIDNRFIATSAGTPGEPIEAFSKESQVNTYYSDFQSALKYAKRIITKSVSPITCPAIFWLQGEWNYQGYGSGLVSGSKPTADKDEYKQLLVKLKNNMQRDIQERYLQDEKPLFITYQVGAQYTLGTKVAIGMAQLEASNEYKDIVCAGPVYPMTDVGGHLDGNGYRWYGEMLGKVYYKTKISGEDFRPLQPKRVAKDPEDTKKVYVTFHVPVPPLVLDENTLKKETNYGFNLYLNNRSQSISKIEIVNDSIVAITSIANLVNGSIGVSYGGSNTRGHGNLRDSDPYQAYFKYENPDKKDENGNFIFPHGTKTSLIPPSGEPKDENGNVIYEQPYPLYNFSVAFYYEIADGEDTFTVPNWDGIELVSLPAIQKDEISIRQAGKSFFVTLPETDTVSIALFDISGKKVRQFEPAKQFSREMKEYSLSAIPSGIYIVKVTAADKTQSAKLIL